MKDDQKSPHTKKKEKEKAEKNRKKPSFLRYGGEKLKLHKSKLPKLCMARCGPSINPSFRVFAVFFAEPVDKSCRMRFALVAVTVSVCGSYRAYTRATCTAIAIIAI